LHFYVKILSIQIYMTIQIKLITTFILSLFFSSLIYGQGMNFFNGTFEEALEIAQKEDKIIFVDAYTSWCGPCKRMKKYIFPNKKAGDFYNKYFINMAIDMETQAGKIFNMTYPVRGYPTFLFINPKGEMIFREVGGKPMELFIMMGQSALKADDNTEEYTKLYESGQRDFDFMLKYVIGLNRAEKPSSTIVYDYLNNGPKLSDEQKAKFLFEATCCCDSKLFEMMTKSKTKKKIIEFYSQQEYDKKIYDACWATVEKGKEYNVQDLYDEAKRKYKKHNKAKFNKFSLEVDLAIAWRNIDASSYLKAAKKYVKLLKKGEEINDFAIESRDKFLRNKDIAIFSTDISKRVLESENTVDNNLAYAKLLLKNKEYSEAISYLDKAINLANEQKIFDKMRELKQLKNMAKRMI